MFRAELVMLVMRRRGAVGNTKGCGNFYEGKRGAVHCEVGVEIRFAFICCQESDRVKEDLCGKTIVLLREIQSARERR